MRDTKIKNELVREIIAFSDRELLLKHGFPPRSTGAELGVNEGDFSKSICEIVEPNMLHLVDIWANKRYNDTKFKNVKKRFRDLIDINKLQIHRCLSFEASDLFADNYFDWIYIDTDHKYETTLKELEAYRKKVKVGGFFFGHDFVKGNIKTGFKYGVIDAVYDFCNKYNYPLKYITLENRGNASFGILKNK